MSHFTADLHIHSRFSRATSKQLTPSHLAAWARIKGIDVLGTGDFTHPEWLAEIEEQMEEDSSGLLVLKDESGIPGEAPWLAGPLEGKTRFMLQGEISSIYKKRGKVRKIHNLVFMPNIEAAKSFNTRLAKVGNLASDGRPILGLDSRDLLEMVLETDPHAHLVPAHIWTPWFSLFGSKSGFDSLKECFGDLASHIFAAETGLSSDPEMNWMWSELDRLKLISTPTPIPGTNWPANSTSFLDAPPTKACSAPCATRASATNSWAPWNSFPRKENTTWTGTASATWCWNPRKAACGAGFARCAASP